MLTDEQRKEIVQRVKAELKKKSEEAQEKEGKIADPLMNMKAIVKHYGSHNRLVQHTGILLNSYNYLRVFKSGNGITPDDTRKRLKLAGNDLWIDV